MVDGGGLAGGGGGGLFDGGGGVELELHWQPQVSPFQVHVPPHALHADCWLSRLMPFVVDDGGVLPGGVVD